MSAVAISEQHSERAHRDDAGWEAHLANLKAYKRRHGDCNVLRKWAEDPKLKWAEDPKRAAELDKLGFNWTPRTGLTDQLVAEAPTCKKCTGQPQAPGKYVQCLMCQKIHTSLESMGHRFFGLVKAAPKKQHAAKKKAASKKHKDTFAPHGGRR
jgi:hypothetical protein